MFTNVAKGVWNISVKKKQGLKKLFTSYNVGNWRKHIRCWEDDN